MLYEKSGIDEELLRRYQRQSAGEGVHLGDSLHGAPLSYFVAKSDGLYCGVGMRHLKDAEKSGGTEQSWKLRRIYLDEIYKHTTQPWIACCSEIPQAEFLKFVEEAAAIYRTGRGRQNLKRWVAGIERQLLRESRLAIKRSVAQGGHGVEYGAKVASDMKEFVAGMKKLIR